MDIRLLLVLCTLHTALGICSDNLVSGSQGVPDDALTASSSRMTAVPSRARLNTTREFFGKGAWMPRTTVDEWIQVRFSELKTIQAIKTKGRDGHLLEHYTKTYTMSYSTDCERWVPYENNMVFDGNTDRDTMVRNVLPTPVAALCVRLYPKTYKGHPDLRFDIEGCSACKIRCHNGATCKKSLTQGDICNCESGFWGKHCENRSSQKWDLTFVVGPSENRSVTEWQKIKDFLDQVVSNIPIGNSGIQIALVTYMPESRIVWKLNDHNHVQSLKQAISRLQDTPGRSDLAGALALVHNGVYTQAGGDRSDALDVIGILVYGGNNIVLQNAVEEAEACQRAGIEIFVFAIGVEAHKNDLRPIATDERRLGMLDSFDELSTLAEHIIKDATA